MTLTPDQKERIVQKVGAMRGRWVRYERILEKCQKLNCPNGTKLCHELDMIKKAASEIIEEVGGK